MWNRPSRAPLERSSVAETAYREGKAKVFEEAIATAGFGAFNIRLLAISALGLAALMFETSSIAFVIPVAECDLILSLVDKGFLNTITYLGMVFGTLPWAILSDTYGRRKVLIFAHLTNGICSLCCALSKNVKVMLFFKFMGGFTISGGYSTLMTYLSEIHSADHRTLIVQVTGIMLTFSSMSLTTIAILVLGGKWTAKIFGFSFFSWQIFLAICGCPSFLFSLIFPLFPESPKYMLTKGQDESVLKTLRRIFAMNTGRPVSEFPIISLDAHLIRPPLPRYTSSHALMRRWSQFEMMFKRKYIYLAARVYLLNFLALMCHNTLRLWLPQVFASFEEYEQRSGAGTICGVLKYTVKKDEQVETDPKCEVHISVHTYLPHYVQGSFSLASFFVLLILRKYAGPRLVLCASLFISNVAILSVYFATSKMTTVLITSVYLALHYLAAGYIIYAVLIYFPTEMRTTILALTMTWGRIGTAIGTSIFPYFLKMGCMPTIIFLGIIGTSFIDSLFLPDPAKVVFV